MLSASNPVQMNMFPFKVDSLTMNILVMSAVSSLLGEDCGRDLPPCKHHVPLGSVGTRIF